MKARLLLITLSAITSAGLLYICFRLSHQTYTSVEIAKAMSVTESKTTAGILEALYKKGLGDRALAHILGASPFTVRRIRSGDSAPTPSFDAAIRGLYSDYLLLDSKLLFEVKYTFRQQDQFYAFMNPIQEQTFAQSNES